MCDPARDASGTSMTGTGILQGWARTFASGVVEKVAEAIYRTSGGMTDQDFYRASGRARRVWKTAQPWDSQPDVELCEWEREEYRLQARAAIRTMNTLVKLLPRSYPLVRSSAS